MRGLHVAALFVSLCVLGAGQPAGAQSPTSAEEHNEQARAFYRTESYLLAAQEFRKAYLVDKDPTRLFNSALAFEKANKLDEAVAAFSEYLQVAPTGDRAVEARARKEALDRKMRETAEAQSLAKGREETRKLVASAIALQAESKHAEAAKLFQRIFEKTGDHQYLFKRADALRLSGRTADAIAGYQDYRGAAPDGVFAEDARQRQQELERQNAVKTGTAAPMGSSPAIDSAKTGSGLRTAGYISGGVGLAVMLVGVTALGNEKDNKETDLLDAFTAEPPRAVEEGAIGEFRSAWRTHIMTTSAGIQGISAGALCTGLRLSGLESRPSTVASCLLVGQGIAALALGGLALGSSDIEDELDQAVPMSQHAEYLAGTLDDTRSLRTAHFVVGGLGVAAGTLIYILGRSSDQDEDSISVVPSLEPGRLGLVGSIRF